MTCSPARIAANRANALKSSGPKTEEGKAKSRANALKHGLTAEVLRTDDEPEIAAEFGTMTLADWLDDEIEVVALRIGRAMDMVERERHRAALRARTCWDEDRGRDVDRVARGLDRNPDRVVRTLRGSVHGCAWLIERWGWLLVAAGQEGGWTDEQQRLVTRLRGIPDAFASEPVDPAHQAGMAEAEIGALGVVRKSLERADAFDRETTERRLTDEATPELRRAIRYEAALMRRLRWCVEQRRAETNPIEIPAPVSAPADPISGVSQSPPASRPLAEPLDLAPFDDLDLALAGLVPASLVPPASFHALPFAMIPTGPRSRVG